MLTHEELLRAIPAALHTITLPALGTKNAGKVRDSYQRDGQRILITTDRVSAFDRVLGAVPFKGQVLNQLSAWWFEQTADMVNNHVVAIPDPNVTIAREAEPLPVEVVVRGYITGVTKTSLWSLYEQGERVPYGIRLPDGLRKHDRLPEPVITPTTKAAAGGHDERLTRDDILERKLIAPTLWEQIETTAVSLFLRGQAVALQADLILVDTKYEFGLIDGQLALIDEIHTPDSSRFWTVASYQARDTAGAEWEPEHVDKEYLRLWFAEQGYRGEGEPPTMTDDFVAQVAARYIEAYERMTGQVFAPGEQPAAARIARALENNENHYG